MTQKCESIIIKSLGHTSWILHTEQTTVETQAGKVTGQGEGNSFGTNDT